MIVGVDRLMSEARAVTNLIGNGVATVVVARWENEFDQEKAVAVLNADTSVQPDAEEGAPRGKTPQVIRSRDARSL